MRKSIISAALTLSCLLIVCLCFISSRINDSCLQPGFDQRQIHINLKKDARKNGYSITVLNGERFLETVNVTNPGTNKLVEEDYKISYRCNESGSEAQVPVILNKEELKQDFDPL